MLVIRFCEVNKRKQSDIAKQFAISPNGVIIKKQIYDLYYSMAVILFEQLS